jgi:hypothetical protein
MAIAYTNRKGVTYYLCRGTTKTGKPRHYFAREPKGDPVEEIPAGWEIRESVNGVVSLAKKRPMQLLPEEIEAVGVAVLRHPEARNYRVDAKQDRITVFERVGPDLDDLASRLRKVGLLMGEQADRLKELLDERARFKPVMRFVLVDKKRRRFMAERMSFLGGTEKWIYVGSTGAVEELARRLIPQLGTDRFFELI